MRVRLARLLFGWWKRLLSTEEQFDMIHGFTVGKVRPEGQRSFPPHYVFKEKKK